MGLLDGLIGDNYGFYQGAAAKAPFPYEQDKTKIGLMDAAAKEDKDSLEKMAANFVVDYTKVPSKHAAQTALNIQGLQGEFSKLLNEYGGDINALKMDPEGARRMAEIVTKAKNDPVYNAGLQANETMKQWTAIMADPEKQHLLDNGQLEYMYRTMFDPTDKNFVLQPPKIHTNFSAPAWLKANITPTFDDIKVSSADGLSSTRVKQINKADALNQIRTGLTTDPKANYWLRHEAPGALRGAQMEVPEFDANGKPTGKTRVVTALDENGIPTKDYITVASEYLYNILNKDYVKDNDVNAGPAMAAINDSYARGRMILQNKLNQPTTFMNAAQQQQQRQQQSAAQNIAQGNNLPGDNKSIFGFDFKTSTVTSSNGAQYNYNMANIPMPGGFLKSMSSMIEVAQKGQMPFYDLSNNGTEFKVDQSPGSNQVVTPAGAIAVNVFRGSTNGNTPTAISLKELSYPGPLGNTGEDQKKKVAIFGNAVDAQGKKIHERNLVSPKDWQQAYADLAKAKHGAKVQTDTDGNLTIFWDNKNQVINAETENFLKEMTFVSPGGNNCRNAWNLMEASGSITTMPGIQVELRTRNEAGIQKTRNWYSNLTPDKLIQAAKRYDEDVSTAEEAKTILEENMAGVDASKHAVVLFDPNNPLQSAVFDHTLGPAFHKTLTQEYNPANDFNLGMDMNMPAEGYDGNENIDAGN